MLPFAEVGLAKPQRGAGYRFRALVLAASRIRDQKRHIDTLPARWQNEPTPQIQRIMKRFLGFLFTWWNSQTLGTLVWTWLYGEFVGEDEFGNRYYRTRGGKIDKRLGFQRRWVVYSGYAEPSSVPPSWHGWLHHTVDALPTEDDYKDRPWQKPHRSNLTGTSGALRPSGSTLSIGKRPRATGDYRPWTPGR